MPAYTREYLKQLPRGRILSIVAELFTTALESSFSSYLLCMLDGNLTCCFYKHAKDSEIDFGRYTRCGLTKGLTNKEWRRIEETLQIWLHKEKKCSSKSKTTQPTPKLV